MDKKLFAVYLGGRAPGCNTELHDVIFVVGNSIDDTYEQLMDKWFGTPEGLHLDSWLELDVVEGYRLSLSNKKSEDPKRLYFINLGAYCEGEFTEVHANKFLVAENKPEAKARGKKELLQTWPSPVHTDDLHELDDCIELGAVGQYYVQLEKTGEITQHKPVNGYHLVPKGVVEEYMQRKGKQAA